MCNNTKIKEWLINLSLIYDENKDYLTKLDADIGDADHGINMSRGFGFVRDALNKDENSQISAIFKQTATLLIKNVGGASGPLYGTFFLNASIVSANKEELTLKDITEIFNKGINAISALGKSKEGEKTMLDTLFPAFNAMKENNENIEDFKSKVLISAENGMKSTIDMIATKGRASYLGERSAGHQDPGATSSFMMIKELINIL
ncbi:dihydroxyacetone kinase subunit DhaL [Brachyspira hampsonii]|uniref:Dihydroxyacetone kinase subunit DhaL n=1 Tax=Brachyspira hampsonii 30446 TaxID=1289135 RepID=A0A2U4FJQ8_9SPIR|nr:dihydroxyacetone kinase subunit DhaL [Brachyspira hampsonii]EKV57481.1 dihydroxyacetone kinase subunit DhaL [Brachyspira hampsonii 30446]MBW5388766.1 dihydroxyacetone kinase subunit L [Brachyspira hampsonii]MBW5395336.1 dihydroxyacetone kinase subunit L [Brachyspira hampsonii]OEJ19922.1 dihydroxyacetone kinase subunit L [Brachyspira hampsonii]PTY40988.1 dihydroxyacetone kinase [Brachyspira hampsonii bv. II]